MDRVFVYSADTKNFLYQLMHSYPPGTMDTSLVSTDYINNPRTMNAVYLLGPRLKESLSWGKETLKGAELNNRQLPAYFNAPDTSWSARVLKDGSDSVGILAALNRVYLNIDLYSEEWMRHFQSILWRHKPITAIEIATAEKEFRPIGAPLNLARPLWLNSCSPLANPTNWPTRQAASNILRPTRRRWSGARRSSRKLLRALPFEQIAGRSAGVDGAGRLLRSRLS